MIEKLEPESVVMAKINELVDHVNDLEEKLLSAEERMEAEDIKKANKALKRGKFINLPEGFLKNLLRLCSTHPSFEHRLGKFETRIKNLEQQEKKQS